MNRLKELWHFLRYAGKAWMADNATRLASAVAFYSILSLAPLVVLAVAIAGMVFGEGAAREGLIHQMRDLVGEEGSKVVETALDHAKKPSAGVLASVIGAVTLLFGASGVFGELHDAMNSIWKVRTKAGRGILGMVRDKFLSFGMVLTIGFLLLVSLVLSTALSAVGDYLSGQAPGVPILMRMANILVSLLVVTGLFAVLFRYLPDARPAWRSVWFGAVATGILFTLGKYLIGLYLGKAAVGSPFGAAGSLVVMVVWVYYSALIVFFGVELTKARADRQGEKVVPLANAEFVPAPAPA
jgi:membrane protein